MLRFQIDPGPEFGTEQAKRSVRDLILDLELTAPTAQFTEVRHPGIAHDRNLLTTVSEVVIAGINLGIFTALFQVVKAWSASRPRAEVTIIYGDGTTLKVSNATVERALELLKQQKTTPERRL
jgi:hypothetical protein